MRLNRNIALEKLDPEHLIFYRMDSNDWYGYSQYYQAFVRGLVKRYNIGFQSYGYIQMGSNGKIYCI